MIERTCKTCGKTFHVYPCRLKASACIYCSSSCFGKDRRGENSPTWRGGPIERTCELCGKSFKTKRKQIKRGWGKFCSGLCSRTYASWRSAERTTKKRVIKKCLICGKNIPVKPSHVKKQGTYCSRKCMAEGYAVLLTRSANPNYKDGMSVDNPLAYYRRNGKEWRAAHKDIVSIRNRTARARRQNAKGKHNPSDIRRMIFRQRNACAYCGCGLGKKYHVDHIIPITRGGSNSIGNLQLLCPSCNTSKSAMLPIEYKYAKKRNEIRKRRASGRL